MNLLHGKIDERVSDAVTNLTNFKTSNTTVTVTKDKVTVKLHGNTIATIHHENKSHIAQVTFNTCGWHTQTTKARLHATLDALHRWGHAHEVKGFKIQKGVMYAIVNDELVSMATPFDYKW